MGDTRTRQLDVRVIAATNRDLKREVETGWFRQDLFYCLSVFPVDIPPQREPRALSDEVLYEPRNILLNPGGAAELSGLRPTTLASRIAALGLKRAKGS